MIRRLAVAAATATLALAPVAVPPATAAGPLTCGKWRVATDQHSISRLCTSGPGTIYVIAAGCCGATGCKTSVFSAWEDYGNRATAWFGPYCYYTPGSANIYTA
jgi:hypothetical protein